MFDKEAALHRHEYKEVRILCLLKMPKLLHFSLTKMVLIIKVLSKS